MLRVVPREISGARLGARLRDSVLHERIVPARRDIVTGDRSTTLHLVISGIAVRYRLLGNGSRQITALLLPGDVCDLGDLFAGRATGNIGAITACAIGEIPRSTLFDTAAPRPEWIDVVLPTLAREADIAMEWIVSLERRSAYEAAAHLFCEIWERMQRVGLTEEMSFPFALTQVDLADVLGLTPVHVNRTLRDLRTAGLILVRGRRATILDLAGLRAAADFDATYLERHEAGSRGLYSR